MSDECRRRRLHQLPVVPLHVDETTVAPAPEVKVLCIMIDLVWLFKSWIAKAGGPTYKRSWPSRLHGGSPLVACQLFTSTAPSKIDYAAFRCCPLRLNTTFTAQAEQKLRSSSVTLQTIAGRPPNAALVIKKGEAGIATTIVYH